MIRFFIILLVFSLSAAAMPAQARNPFLAGKEPAQPPRPVIAAPGGMLVKIALWQQMLRTRMAELIRRAGVEKSLAPLGLVLAMAFGYGVLHAAGPGHGKAVAMGFMLSQRASLGRGLLFAVLVAFFHGLSGAALVLALKFILETSVTGTLAEVSRVTQAVSYTLIILLGIAIFFQNGRSLFFSTVSRNQASGRETGEPGKNGRKRGLLVLAASVGMVPCPGVVMVMLFCLSMGMLPLGLVSAAFISLGMAVTISLVVSAVVLGRGVSLTRLSEQKSKVAEAVLGLVSGSAVAALGLVFLLGVIV